MTAPPGDPATGSLLFHEGRIGRLRLPNRFVRAATYETMATAAGEVTDQLVRLYEDLARGGVGLILTGHVYVHPRGQYYHRQIALHDDAFVPGLARLASAVHVAGGRIFAELSHAGSQSRMPGLIRLAPSPVTNPRYGHEPAAATDAEIVEVVEAFAAAAGRLVRAGFDGVHMHGGHGYLISEFSSPHTNRRTDRWGGDAERRGRFAESVVQAVRRAVGPDVPVAMKLGVCDAIPGGGLTLDEGLALAERLARAGLDAIEVSVGLTVPGAGSARTYVAVDRRRAWQDGLLHRLASAPTPEGYFAEWARAVKTRVRIPVIVIGGLRRVETMERMLREGVADFVSLARPFVREPHLVRTIAAGRTGLVACTSCNICLMHEGRDVLRCWRRSWRDLLEHAFKHYVLDPLGLRRA